MKIAILGSAPSSLGKAPFGDPSWKIWACSPGAYPRLGRIDEFWEVHRWEPGVIGKAESQKPWFSPEYVAWLKSVPPVLWVSDPAALAECQNARPLPWRDLVAKYGSYVWNSSVAYMTAMAIDRIQAARAERAAMKAAREAAAAAEAAARKERGEPDPIIENGAMEPVEVDSIAFFGIDMAANEELYSNQRASCQFFLQVIAGLGIDFYVPPESDLCTPPPMYGVSETSHRAIKWLERKRELEARLAQTNATLAGLQGQANFLQGALDDVAYFSTMWLFDGEDTLAFDFEAVFPGLAEGREYLSKKTVASNAALAPVETAAVGGAATGATLGSISSTPGTTPETTAPST